MFGYVRPPAQDLPEGELNRFRTMYCGLCHTLSRRYGQAARMILNYDFTYLAILLSNGTADAENAGRCWVSPVKKRPYLEPTAAMELAADESVILAYWQLQDGAEDHDLGCRPEIPGRCAGFWKEPTGRPLPSGRNLTLPCAASFGCWHALETAEDAFHGQGGGHLCGAAVRRIGGN